MRDFIGFVVHRGGWMPLGAFLFALFAVGYAIYAL